MFGPACQSFVGSQTTHALEVGIPYWNLFILQNIIVRSGIRTHAYKSRLRPERSALDRSAILTRPS